MWTCSKRTIGSGTSSVIYKYLQIKPGAQVLHVPFNVFATTTARFQLLTSAIHLYMDIWRLIRLACYLLLSLLGLKCRCSKVSQAKPAQPIIFWEQMFDYIDNNWTEADRHSMSSQKDKKCLLALFDGLSLLQ